MGSYSNLRIARLNIDTCKNQLNDHSVLFCASDRKNVDYYYAGGAIEQKPGYIRKLYDIAPRLNILGYTKKHLEEVYKEYKVDYEEDIPNFTMDILDEIIGKIDITKSIWDEEDEYSSNTEIARKIGKVIETDNKYEQFIPQIEQIKYFLDEFDAYIILSLFIKNSTFMSEDVVWEYYDIYINGWIKHDVIIKDDDNYSSCIIITEGSSDTKILKAAFEWIYPDLLKFFDFIDMDKNYPFTGVGNLVNFYNGLCKIGTSKRVVMLFDNDTAGNAAIANCINKKWNIHVANLPSYHDFDSFKTKGPSGDLNENINGKAVSIELFLDLNYKNSSEPFVRWVSYDSKIKQYQGVLENKEHYSKRFFTAKNIKDSEYSLGKLKYVLDFIIKIVSDSKENEGIY
jgi:hypothetical protein